MLIILIAWAASSLKAAADQLIISDMSSNSSVASEAPRQCWLHVLRAGGGSVDLRHVGQAIVYQRMRIRGVD